MSERNRGRSALARLGGKPEFKPRLAIPALRNIPSERSGAQWRHWIVGVDAVGRVTLPADARHVAHRPAAARSISRDAALVLHGGELGAEIQMDSRGRIVLPAWLRRLSEASGSVLVAAPSPDVSVVVVLPTCALDELVDAVVGEVD